MLKEFKDFIAKGNVMDMAVGIIIGAAFTAIVKSLVGDLINPIISLFMGGIDFSGMYSCSVRARLPQSPPQKRPGPPCLPMAGLSWRSSIS
jgi:large conductance mechanosensitive channel protein